MDRNAIIQWLTTNSESWKSPGDQQILARFSDDKLSQLYNHEVTSSRAIAVANAAVNGFTDGGTAYRINPETGKVEKKLVGNNPPPMPPPAPPPPSQASRSPAPNPMTQQDQSDGGSPSPSPSPSPEMDNAMPRRQVATNRRRTSDEWYRNAPPDVQESLRAAREIETREKTKIISQLLVNVAEIDKRAHYDRLIGRSLTDLQNDLSMMPRTPTTEDVNRVNNAVPNRRRHVATDNDMLVPQILNWDETATTTANANTSTQYEPVDNGALDDGTDEEYLAKLPPRLRNKVENAVAIESRERRRLIDEITSNMSENDEKRMRRKLEHKPLEDLRDYLQLAGRQQPRPAPNYFGAAGASPNVLNAAGRDDDLLLPPDMSSLKD